MKSNANGIAIPPWVVGLAVPAGALLLLSAFDAAWSWSAERAVDRDVVHTRLLVAYAAYAVLFLAGVLVKPVMRKLPLAGRSLAIAAMALGVLALASGHYRAAGVVLLATAAFSVAAVLPGLTLRRPRPLGAAYAGCAIVVPVLGGTLLAARSGGPTSETFGTAWALLALYLMGFAGASVVRAWSPVAALFASSFWAFWGIAFGLLFAPLLFAGIVGIGGVAASLPYLWEAEGERALLLG